MEVFKLIGKLAIEGLPEAESAMQKMGSVATKMGKAVAAGIAAGSAAIVALGKSAVESYAEYEQLVGGVETLFKDSADTVQQYAQNAYKTAGLSANAYMETVTSFSASLLQSLNGDTAKAAEVADRAITDMSDNANKMGTSMESIQNAYQGFAKQNYTMLDNLKLGYGGTKEEMQRLLEDAEKLSGQKFDLSSYADIVEAIHVVQTEMGITGTTAKEASSTIQGSATAMKAAWQNLLTGMADENQNLELLLEQFLDSVTEFGNNLIPIIEKLLPRLVSAAAKLVNNLAARLPAIIEKLLPVVIQGATNLVASLVKNLPQLTKSIITAIVNGLKAGFPAVKEAGSSLLKSLWNGLKSVWNSVSSWISSKLSWITDKFNAVKNFVSGIKNAVTGVSNTNTGTSSSKVKAHAAGGILTKPTIFGYTPATDTYHLGGEAGDEAIAPIDKLQGYVRAAVEEANQNNANDRIYAVLAKILYMLQNNKITAVMDGEKMGEFVIQTVEREVYA